MVEQANIGELINELAKQLGVEQSRFNNWLGSPQTRLARKDLDKVISFLKIGAIEEENK
ncbi:hypothetical protein JDS87_15630 [Bacillus cereus]|uniref:hypothetical protein n=1 Tax=Bacillus cereus TaxID=1396 RepID=UPI0018F35DAE|nr:hypothetical protein [Bacillus cereus]MBJ8053362.1 hypothetical protein [Bacillus cereus]